LLDLIGGLKPGRQSGLELAKADIMEARGVDMVAGEPAARAAADLDRPVDRPVGVLRVVDGDKDLPIHGCSPLRPLDRRPSRRIAPAWLWWTAACTRVNGPIRFATPRHGRNDMQVVVGLSR